MTITKKEFLTTLVKSRVLELDTIRTWLAETDAQDGVALANQMVNSQMLTDWQAKYLLTGRYRLDVAGYRLLDRISRDELGDRFLAIHRQLNRNVEILFLSPELTKENSRREEFLRRASRTMELDHHNLCHVFDLDHEGGRYYLVTEHFFGEPWATAITKISDTRSAALLFRQLINGLEYLHDNQLWHGDLTDADLFIDQDQFAKIMNIAISQFRKMHPQNQGNSTALGDWNALGRIGSQSLNSLLKSLANQVNQKELSTVGTWFDELTSSKEPRPLVAKLKTELDRLAEKKHSLPAQSPGFEDGNFSKANPLSQSSDSKSALPIQKGLNSMPSAGAQSATVIAEGSPSRQISQQILKHPWAFLSSSFLAGMFVIGLLTYLYHGFVSTGSPLASNEEMKPVVHAKESPSLANLPSENDTTTARPTTPKPAAAVAPMDPLDGVDRPPTETTAMADQADATAQSRTEPAEDGSATQRQSDASTADVTPAVTATTPPIASLPPPSDNHLSTKTEADASSDPPAELTEGVDPKLFESPFQNLPQSITLPQTAVSIPQKLGEVYVSDRFLLGVELISAGALGASNLSFEMERDALDKQKWLIHLVRGSSDRKTTVAVVQRNGTELLFHWLEEANKVRQSGFLQNCILKVFTPEHSAWLRLREPVTIEPILFKSNSLTATVPVEIEFPPPVDSWLIEVLTPAIEEISLNPNVIDLKQGLPGRVLLKKDDKKPLVWVNLELDMRQKIRLRGDLAIFEGQAKASATSVERFVGRPLKNLAELETLSLFWKNQDQLLGQRIQIIDGTTAPRGMGEAKSQTLAELRKQQTQAREFGTKLAEYQGLAPKMLDQPYGVRIVARYPEGLEVELAKSNMTAVANSTSED